MNNRANERRIKFYLDYAECSRLKAKPIMSLCYWFTGVQEFFNYEGLLYNLTTL
jgi:hypothetical protein